MSGLNHIVGSYSCNSPNYYMLYSDIQYIKTNKRGPGWTEQENPLKFGL
jgi:hypothetical protein